MIKKMRNLPIQQQILSIIVVTMLIFNIIEIRKINSAIATFENELVPKIVAIEDISQTAALIMSETYEFVAVSEEETLEEIDVYYAELSQLIQEFEGTFPEVAQHESYIAMSAVLADLVSTQESIILSHQETHESLEILEELEEETVLISQQVSPSIEKNAGVVLSQFINALFSAEREVVEYVNNPESDALEDLETRKESITELYVQLDKSSDPEILELKASLGQNKDELITTIDLLVASHTMTTMELENLEETETTLEASLLEVSALATAQIAERGHQLRLTSALFTLIGLAISTLISIYIIRIVLLPIKKMSEITSLIASGDFHHKVETVRSDVVGELASNFNHMTESLEASFEEIEALHAESARIQKRKIHFLEATTKVGKLANSLYSADVLLPLVVKSINEHFAFYYTGIFLVDTVADQAVLQTVYVQDNAALAFQKDYTLLLSERNFIVEAIKKGQAEFRPDVSEEGLFYEHPKLPKECSEAVMPLIAGKQVLGALHVQFSAEVDFGQNDLAVLNILADQVAIALENASLFSEAKESRQRFSLAVEGAKDGVWDWQLGEDHIYFSPRWKSMLGLDEDANISKLDDWYSLVHEDDRPNLEQAISDHIAGRTPHLQCEHRLRHNNGSYRWMLCRGQAVQNGSGKPSRMAGSLTDITERKLVESQLHHSATHDALTELPNRALFQDRLQQAIHRKKRNEEFEFAVIFLDLDRFKIINDSLGHKIGDLLLIELAERLQKQMRAVDTVARLGGDEFVILLEDLKGDQATEHFAKRILKVLSEPVSLEGHEIINSASIGIVLGHSQYQSPHEYLQDADTAMYHAKAMGKSRYEIFTPSLRQQAIFRLTMEADLRKAIENQEFGLHYQPVTELDSGIITGFEALIRWYHPEQGLVSPGVFIPLAEETGLILLIGEWVLEEACKQIATWQKNYPADPPLSVNVNLSSRQLLQPELVNQIKHILESNNLPGSSLNLEITETTIVQDTERVAVKLEQLKDLGVSVQMDDFGTGYSSLGYLRHLPMDVIKIDRSFIEKMDPGENKPGLVRSIIHMAQDLGLKVVAEGIERDDQKTMLTELGCDFGQGFYIARPQDPKAIETLLQNNEMQPEKVQGS